MIEVQCIGHIATSVGAKRLAIEGATMTPAELVEAVRSRSRESDPGFTIYNTLLLLEDGEASVVASSESEISDGQKVTLVPFSHGG